MSQLTSPNPDERSNLTSSSSSIKTEHIDTSKSAPAKKLLYVSNLDKRLAKPENLFTLFGIYGNVFKVKLCLNREIALIEMANSVQAKVAQKYLFEQKVFGKNIHVGHSKYQSIHNNRMKNFENSPLHRSNHYSEEPSEILLISNVSEKFGKGDFFQKSCKCSYWHHFESSRMTLAKFDSTEIAIGFLIGWHNYIFEGCQMKVEFADQNSPKLSEYIDIQHSIRNLSCW